MKNLNLAAVSIALAVASPALAQESGAPSADVPSPMEWGVGAAGGWSVYAGADGGSLEAFAVLDLARTPHRYVRFEGGLLYGTGTEPGSIALTPLPGRAYETQRRTVMGATVSAAWGWRWTESWSARFGVVTGLVRGVVDSPTCGEHAYLGPPLMASTALAWAPARSWEVSLQGDLGSVPVPECISPRLDNEEYGREFVQRDIASGLLTLRVVTFF